MAVYIIVCADNSKVQTAFLYYTTGYHHLIFHMTTIKKAGNDDDDGRGKKSLLFVRNNAGRFHLIVENSECR